jgi:hypothetical protein
MTKLSCFLDIRMQKRKRKEEVLLKTQSIKRGDIFHRRKMVFLVKTTDFHISNDVSLKHCNFRV